MATKKLFCLIGRSGSGKTTVLNKIIESEDIYPVTTYTTRPMRPGEKDGDEYHFISKDKMDSLKIIEKRDYEVFPDNSSKDIWSYATIDNLERDKDYIMVATPSQVEQIKKYKENNDFPFNVITIFLYVDPDILLKRLYERESLKEVPNYKEIIRRLISDGEECNIERNKTNYFIYNNQLDEAYIKIKNIMDFEMECY